MGAGAKAFGIFAFISLGTVIGLNLVSLRPDPSYLVDTPQILKLKSVEKDRLVEAELDWQAFEIGLSGLSVKAEIEGHFRDADVVLNELINPTDAMALVEKKRLKILHMPNSSLRCEGAGYHLNCQGRIAMKIDAGFLKIKNTLSLKSQSTSELIGDQITFRHRILSGEGVPSLIIEELNERLAEKDKTRSLPNFFIKRNVEIIDYAFLGASDSNDLRLRFSIRMGLSDLLASLL